MPKMKKYEEVKSGGAASAEPLDDVISASDFSVYYGKFHAVKNVNMGIRRGKVTAIIGPSGCGKSTFLRWTAPTYTTSAWTLWSLGAGWEWSFSGPIPSLRAYTKTSPMECGLRARRERQSSTKSSKLPCARRRSGTRLRTG